MGPKPHPALSRLERFVGSWDLTMDVGGESLGGVTATFEWLDGGAFLLERSEWAGPGEMPPGAPMPTTRIIGYDDTADQFTALYADGRGVARVYQMSLAGDHWEVWRDAPGFGQRYLGDFDSTGEKIHGRWEKSLDNRTWELDFHLTYTKIA